MKDPKVLCRRLLFPPLWVVILLTAVSTIALTAVFVMGMEETPVAYVSYVTAFYSLTVLSLACWKTLPAWYRRAKGKLSENTYAVRYMTDAGFKTRVSLHISVVIDLLYVAVNGVAAAVYQTRWFAIFAVYHAIMAIIRFVLVQYAGKNELGKKRAEELKRARLCACILLTVNMALLGAVLMMVYFDRGFSYQGFLIYVMALYTFYITAAAIVDMVKYRKYNSPVMSASKVVKLTAALMSMLSLETAMLSQFGADTPPHTRKIMIVATGVGISVIVAVMAVYMIVRSTIEIKELKKRNDIYGTSQ